MQILCESNTGNPAEPVGIIFGGIKAMEFDDLIGLNTLGLVGLLGIQPSETEIAFGPDDENPGHEGGKPQYRFKQGRLEFFGQA
jgi:hypothetical protein